MELEPVLSRIRPDMADGIDSGLSGKALMVIIFSIRGGGKPRLESGQVIGRTVQLIKLLCMREHGRTNQRINRHW